MALECTQSERLERLEESIENCNKAIFVGNGKPAIQTSLALMSQAHKEIESRLARIETVMTRIGWVVVLAVIGAILKSVIK